MYKTRTGFKIKLPNRWRIYQLPVAFLGADIFNVGKTFSGKGFERVQDGSVSGTPT